MALGESRDPRLVPREKSHANSIAWQTAGAQKSAEAATGTDARSRRSRLTFKEERELALLPARIETLEARIDAIRHRLADPALYRDAVEEAKTLRAELAQLESELTETYSRWEVLEDRKSSTDDVGG